ncbi:MAG: adenylate/guanylate cyclase domain-containing protein [Vulcanimicrobiota bacterium]
MLIFSLEGPTLVLTPSGEPHLPQRAYKFNTNSITVGSGQDCDLIVPRTAPLHARIERNELGVILSDLGSPEGTFLNGKRIVRARLQSGDHIQLATGSGAPAVASGGQQTVLGTKTFAVKPIPDIKSGTRENLVGQQGLLHLSAALARPGALEDKLDEILDFSLRLGSFDRASIWVVDPDNPNEFLYHRRRQSRGQAPAEVSKTVLQQVLRGEALIIQDAQLDQRVENAQSIKLQNIRTCVGLPLATSNRIWGVLYLDSLQPKALTNTTEQEFLGGFAALAAVAIENGWLSVKAQKEALFKDRLARFFPPATVNTILARSDGTSVRGAEMNVTILFCDIRNYTGISFEQPPAKVAAWINDYFSRIVPIVFNHGGTLEKYIGDAMLAIWGAPLEMSPAEQALHSCRAAIEIHQAVREFAAQWPDLPCQVGIGIHHGLAYVGTIGHESYLQYAALGSTTNLAARLCSAAGPGETILSKYLSDLLPTHEFINQPRPPVQAKGFPEVVDIALLQPLR